jgi:hypothetical protein
MAAIYVYECPDHGRFEVPLKFGGDVPTSMPCPVGPEPFSQSTVCGAESKRIILPPAGVHVQGGTGARSAG